jgi:hypothetical protein
VRRIASIGYAITCDQLIDDRITGGQAVNWPAGVNPDEAEKESDYPKDIWKDAANRWDAQTADQKQTFRDAATASMVQGINTALGSLESFATKEGFLASFGVIDLLFGALAIGTAFKLGSGETLRKA